MERHHPSVSTSKTSSAGNRQSLEHRHTHRGRGSTSRIKLIARLRVMRSVVAPTLTTFGRSRTWTRGQIGMLQSAQNYALQRVFGLDKLAMHELHITTEQLHRAAVWPTIQQVLMTHTLKWLGHICRMPIDRLPKLALFGTWIHNTRSPTKAHTQTYWISEVLRTADIHQLDFFRLAQNRDPTLMGRIRRPSPTGHSQRMPSEP